MITQNGVGITALLNGETVKQALDPANETVSRGIYNATTLSAVDADLATANIRNGITMFGFAGSADVHDISDATAIEAEVLAPETFYAVVGGIRTGTMPIQTLNPANENVPAGYYGATTLSAVDAQLAAANILSGVNIFGFVGVATVQDIADANALVGEVLNPRTFYSVTGARKTGTMATRTLNPANETVQAGYYAATTLSAVDAQLAAVNILSGVNIFGFVGVATVQDIADADAVLADVMNGKTFYSVTGGRKTGNLATVTLAADNNAYPTGYHAGAGNLAVIDASLAAGNIRSGVNIFGYIGAATVQEIGAADAVLADVRNGKTFFSVTGGIKTGNMPTVALAPGSSAYPAGYHVGDGGGLPAIDGDLITANIKNGITIFNVAGHVDVRNVSDANALVGEVKNGRTFYAVGGARKTGTMPTVALAAGANAYPAGYHAGAASLTAVDGDLAAGNIADGITIFGVLGTFVGGALVEDVVGTAKSALTVTTQVYMFYADYAVAAGGDLDIATKTLVFAAGSRAVATGLLSGVARGPQEKMRLYMGGVQVAESGLLSLGFDVYLLIATRALSGSQECKITVHNYEGTNKDYRLISRFDNGPAAAGIGVGSIKT